MIIYDTISIALNLPFLNEQSYHEVYLTPLEKTSIKTHNSPNKGIKFDSEWCSKISESNKGRTSPMKGIPLPDSHPFKTGIGKDYEWTQERRDKVSKKLSGRKLSDETKQKLSAIALARTISPRLNKPHSEETKRKISETKRLKREAKLSDNFKQDNI